MFFLRVVKFTVAVAKHALFFFLSFSLILYLYKQVIKEDRNTRSRRREQMIVSRFENIPFLGLVKQIQRIT